MRGRTGEGDEMEIITGTADSLPTGVHSSLARYRHRVFIEMLGWRQVIPQLLVDLACDEEYSVSLLPLYQSDRRRKISGRVDVQGDQGDSK
jgi:hypothetical protein